MNEEPQQLTLEDETATTEAMREGFDGWDVFKRPAPKRRWHTAAELAARWRMSPEQAEEWLEAFERTGFACRQGNYWLATERARKVMGLGPDG
jgi:hypothetical protein